MVSRLKEQDESFLQHRECSKNMHTFDQASSSHCRVAGNVLCSQTEGAGAMFIQLVTYMSVVELINFVYLQLLQGRVWALFLQLFL